MTEDSTERRAKRLATVRDRVTTGMDRRRFVRTLVTGGYALGMARLLGVESFLGADDGEVPVVTALVRSDPEDPWSLERRTRTVPADWYAAVQRAFELNERLADWAFAGYVGSAVVPGDYGSGGASISVGIVGNRSSPTDVLAEVADGVSIDVDRVLNPEAVEEEFESLSPRIVDAVGDDVPSGIACETPSSLATLGPALYDPDSGESFFATAAHAFTDDDRAGAPLSVPIRERDPVALGTVARAHPVVDIAVVRPGGEIAPSVSISAPTETRVRGQLTRWGLADLVARGESLQKVGALTGHTTGRIQGIDAVTCFTEEYCRRGQIRWGSEMDLTDGDSGSVSYHPDPEGEEGDVLVAGLNNARTWWPGQSYVWGTAAYQLTEQLGYHF